MSRKFAGNGAFAESANPISFTGSAFEKNGEAGLFHHVGAVEFRDSHASQNTGDGITSGTLSAGGTPPATTLGVLDDSSMNGNGGAGIRTGGRSVAEIRGDPIPSALTEVEATGNGGPGMQIGGQAFVTTASVQDGGSDGIVVDIDSSADLRVQLFDTDIMGNDGDGYVLRDSGEFNETTYSSGVVARNGGDGVHVGGVPGRLAILSASGLDIHHNAVGVVVEDYLTSGDTALELQANDIHDNTGEGLIAGRHNQSEWLANKFHNNGLDQIVFDGGGNGAEGPFYLNASECGLGTNQVYGYGAAGTFGIFARNNATVDVQFTAFEGGGTGLQDWSAQAGSSISVTNNCPAP